MQVDNLLDHERVSIKNSPFNQSTNGWGVIFFLFLPSEERKLERQKRPMWQFEQLPN